MKILHISAGNLFGGIETLFVTLAKEQSLCQQMQPQFALCFEGRLAEELENLGTKVHQLGNVKISHPLTVWKARNQLQQVLKQEQFDVVVCHACWPQAVFGSVVKANNIPLVFWCHDVVNGKHPVEQLAKLISPDLVIANSRYTQRAVPNLYQTYSETVYLPVAAPQFSNYPSIRHAIRTELNTCDDAIVIIQASRLERWKGHSLLISSLAKLRELPGWVCWLAGGAQRPHESEYLQELKNQTQELGISEQIRFLGQRSDVPSLLAAADIHCQPNTGPEPYGIAFIEALYAGLPVVTTAMGGVMEIVDQTCGRLVAPNDINALSDILATLITNPLERGTLGSGGKSRAEYLCNPEKQLNRVYNLLSQVVKQKVAA